MILLSNGALAPSADTEQFFERDGVRYSHILDPRTGSPMSNHAISVTVVAKTGVEADALATAVFVLGTDGGLEIIRARPGVEALVVTEEADGRLTIPVSSGMRRRFLPAQVEARPPGE